MLWILWIPAHASSTPSPPLDSDDQRDTEGYSCLQKVQALIMSHDPLAFQFKDISLAGIRLCYEDVDDMLLHIRDLDVTKTIYNILYAI